MKYNIETNKGTAIIFYLFFFFVGGGGDLRLNSCYTETNPQLTWPFFRQMSKNWFQLCPWLAVEPELLPCFAFFCPPSDRNIPKYTFQYAFCLSKTRTIKKKKKKNKSEKVAPSRWLWFSHLSPILCFQPSPTGFNLAGTLSFATRALAEE